MDSELLLYSSKRSHKTFSFFEITFLAIDLITAVGAYSGFTRY